MDDFRTDVLHDSRDEWTALLLGGLTPSVLDGLNETYAEAVEMCRKTKRPNDYLLVFQSLLERVPKWNASLIEKATRKALEHKRCNSFAKHLQDILTAIHITMVKKMSAVRVGQKQKKIDIAIPNVSEFVHAVYINASRNMYRNAYLYSTRHDAVQTQRNNRTKETLVREAILLALRERMPLEAIFRAYLDETVEEDVVEERTTEIVHEPLVAIEGTTVAVPTVSVDVGAPTSAASTAPPPVVSNTSISFNDIDYVQSDTGSLSEIHVPKSVEDLAARAQAQAQAQATVNHDDSDLGDLVFGEEIPLDEFETIDSDGGSGVLTLDDAFDLPTF